MKMSILTHKFWRISRLKQAVLSIIYSRTNRLKMAHGANNFPKVDLISLINNQNNSIWSIDKDFNYIITNKFFKDEYFRIHGVQLHKGTNAIDILNDELKSIWKPKYEEALSGKKVIFHFDIKTNKDHYFYEIYLNPIYSHQYISGVSCSSIDVTHIENAKNALLESDQNFKTFTNQSIDGIGVADIKGNYTFVNPAFCKMVGWSEEELLKMTVF